MWACLGRENAPDRGKRGVETQRPAEVSHALLLRLGARRLGTQNPRLGTRIRLGHLTLDLDLDRDQPDLVPRRPRLTAP